MKISNGVYLVADPSMEPEKLIRNISQVIDKGIVALQLWDHFTTRESWNCIDSIGGICAKHQVPLIINNRWELLDDARISGVHFDTIPLNFNEIKQKINRSFLAGITCNNDLSVVHWANKVGLDYISFCSMFPSVTANSCDRVAFETVKMAREITNLPIFLAGGITPENLHLLNELDYSGIAVVSGIMNAPEPVKSLQLFNNNLKPQIYEPGNHR